MSALSDKLIVYFRKKYFADKLGPSYRDEFNLTQQFFSKEIVMEELAYTKGFSDCKKYLDDLLEAIRLCDPNAIDQIREELEQIDEFSKETYD